MNTEALLSYVSSTPLTWLILTISAYKVGVFVYEKMGKNALFQPMIIALLLILPVVIYAKFLFKPTFNLYIFCTFF